MQHKHSAKRKLKFQIINKDNTKKHLTLQCQSMYM